MGNTPGDGVMPQRTGQSADFSKTDIDEMFEAGLRKGLVSDVFRPVADWITERLFTEEECREDWKVSRPQHLHPKVLEGLVKLVVGESLYGERSTEPSIQLPDWLKTVVQDHWGSPTIDTDKLRIAQGLFEKALKQGMVPTDIRDALSQAPTKTVEAIIRGLSPGALLSAEIMLPVLQAVQDSICAQTASRRVERRS
jgi:hypothetical protein